MNEVLDTWVIHNRINLYLLDAIDQQYFTDALASKGRNVWEQFAHMHNVRLMWLKAAAPELLEGQIKLEKEAEISKAALTQRLTESANAILQLLEKGIAEGKIKNFKPHPTAFLDYLIAHESHHRSQVIIALKQSGHKIDQKVMFGLWEWGTR